MFRRILLTLALVAGLVTAVAPAATAAPAPVAAVAAVQSPCWYYGTHQAPVCTGFLTLTQVQHRHDPNTGSAVWQVLQAGRTVYGECYFSPGSVVGGSNIWVLATTVSNDRIGFLPAARLKGNLPALPPCGDF